MKIRLCICLITDLLSRKKILKMFWRRLNAKPAKTAEFRKDYSNILCVFSLGYSRSLR
jgi:hypothetical protein